MDEEAATHGSLVTGSTWTARCPAAVATVPAAARCGAQKLTTNVPQATTTFSAAYARLTGEYKATTCLVHTTVLARVCVGGCICVHLKTKQHMIVHMRTCTCQYSMRMQ